MPNYLSLGIKFNKSVMMTDEGRAAPDHDQKEGSKCHSAQVSINIKLHFMQFT